MKNYQTLFIIKPDLEADEFEKVINKIGGLIEKYAKITNKEVWRN